MKFKYYLRGAGIGVIAATVILSVAFLFQDDMSDAQIIQRALELGMVMEEGSSKTLADVSPQGTANTEPESNADDDKSGKNSDDDTPEGQSDTDDKSTEASQPDTDKKDDDKKETPKQSEKPSKPDTDAKDNNPDRQDSGNTVTVTIVGGDVSRTVSAKVFEAGLVESADEFNNFLGSNNYDNLLQPGTYEIARGSSFEEIARILTAR